MKRELTVRDLPAMISQGELRLLPLIIVLILIWMVMQYLTGGLFLSARNLTNLSGQVAITAMLTSGAVLVMIPGFIDLSLGATVAAAAVVAALAGVNLELPLWLTIVATLGFGLLIGVWHAFWIAWMKVPSFIVTLGSLLAIRGLSLVITNAETISPNPDILVISDTSLSPTLSVIVLMGFWLAFAMLQMREWRARQQAGIQSSFLSVVGIPVASVGIFASGVTIVAVSYRGLPLPVVFVLAVVALTGWLLRYTAFGRRLYAIGGNRQAALLAGINIRAHVSMVFAFMGLLYGLAGLVLVARLDSAPPGAMQGLELNVIAAAVIGGTSLMGGRGTVAGAVIGAILMESLSNGMSLMNLPSAYQSITVGLVLLFAVYADMRGRGGRLGD
ncbi:sugar ABC transporter permease [Rhizobium etli]|nr:sugar ABC transporter permease [Rhizobium etli]